MAHNEEDIGHTFQQKTKYWRNHLPMHRLNFTAMPSPLKEYPDALQVPLPNPITAGGPSIWETIAMRRSHRQFATKSLALEDLSQVLWASQGITYKTQGFGFRAAPSAGALYPTETYFVARNVSGLPPGLYHYNVYSHLVECLKEGDIAPDLATAALDQEFVAAAPLTIIWTAVIPRSTWKYLQRAYRYIYLDAGHVAENLMLAATALGLGTCGIGAIYDDEVNHILGVDGEIETAIYLCAVGKLREGNK